MPIDYRRYPAEWPQIRQRILDRDGNCCAFCGAPNGAYIVRDRRNPEKYEVLADLMSVEVAGVVDGLKTVRVVLTIAHVHNDDPQDVREENLAALCQRCHLRLDAGLHARHAAETRRRKVVSLGQAEFTMETAHV